MDGQSAMQQINLLSTNILDYALLLASVGTLSMAFVELLKAVFLLRKKYHRVMIRSWIRTMDQKNVLRELLYLAVGGKENANAFYDQPVAKMLGQIQSAANIALEFPDRFEYFYMFLTGADEKEEKEENDSAAWRNMFSQTLSGEKKGNVKTLKFATQARARLDHLVARKLDALQTKIEYRWARFNQGLSIPIGTVVLVYVLQAAGINNLLINIPLSIFGGMLAPFAKDVVSAVSSIRTSST